MLTEAPLKELFEEKRAEVEQELKDKPRVIALNQAALKPLPKKIPACIRYILDERPPKSETVNFNQLTMTLVTYFQMARYTESKARSVIEPFLENYLSSDTYDTAPKRLEHWQNQWKYIKGTPDYNFGCSYVKGLKLPGSAFSCSRCNVNVGVKIRKPSDFSSDEIIGALHENEDGDADLLIKLLKDRFCFDHTEGRWYARKVDGHWAEDLLGNATAAVKEIIEVYAIEQKRQNTRMLSATTAGKNTDNIKDTISSLLKRIHSLRSKNRKANIIYLAACGSNSLGISGFEWDSNPWLLGCANGIVDLKTGELLPIDPKAYIKTVAPAAYHGPNTPAPTWEKFLSEIFNHDTELVDFWQRLSGYSMIGEATEDIFPILWGEEGRNGKDTLFETKKSVLGPYASPIESELLLAQRFNKRAGTATPELKVLRGKRIVWASETEEGRRFDVAKIKFITGGGTIVTRGLYDRRMTEFEPSHTLFLITNPKPKAKGDDAAFWERVLLIPLTQRFVDNPQGSNEHQADIYMLDKLKSEAPGILAWFIRGCLKWQQQGLNPPATVKDATEIYKKENDDLGCFVDECCIKKPNSQVRANELFEEYKNWAEKNADKTLSQTAFGKKIIRFSDDDYKDKKGKVYVGIGLIEKETENIF